MDVVYSDDYIVLTIMMGVSVWPTPVYTGVLRKSPVKRPYFCDFARKIASAMLLNAHLFVISRLNEVFWVPGYRMSQMMIVLTLKAFFQCGSRVLKRCSEPFWHYKKSNSCHFWKKWIFDCQCSYFCKKCDSIPFVFLQICARIRNWSHCIMHMRSFLKPCNNS